MLMSTQYVKYVIDNNIIIIINISQITLKSTQGSTQMRIVLW